MSDKASERRGPGPLGSSNNRPAIDLGTLALTKHLPPGPVRLGSSDHSVWEIAVKKFEYLQYARSMSYVMQGKSAAESAVDWTEREVHKLGLGSGKPQRVQSYLGGAFLRMYLDGKTDPDTVAEAGVEIGDSPEFKRLSEELNKFLQAEIDHLPLTNADAKKLATLANHHLKHIKATKGISFRYTLNAVIGGVSDVDVPSVNHLSDINSPQGTVSRFRVNITFSDTYDFENKRSGEYDRYRKELARYLIFNDFEKFESAYAREVRQPFDNVHKTHLDNAAVFASYMYALEQKKWTPGGLKWEVTVPTEINLVFKPSHHTRTAHHSQAR